MMGRLSGDVVSLVSQLKEKHPDSVIVLVHGCKCESNTNRQ